MNALLTTAGQYVITDQNWDLLDFATQMSSLTAGNLTFRTLPIVGYETIDGQDANQVDPALIKQLVQETFYPAPSSAASKPHPASPASTAGNSKFTVDIYNGGRTEGLASEVASALVKQGYLEGTVGNTAALTTTEVLYGSGAASAANTIAGEFNVSAAPSTSVAAGQVEVLLGADATVPSAATPAATTQPVAVPTTGAQGGAVNSGTGIPCVD